MSETVLKQKLMVPVGRSVYTELRKDNCAYADKTVLIPTLEGLYSRYPFIIRPRRFGKSLFMSMLETYYDRAQKEDFDKNFSGTYIYDHKSPLQGQYFILHLDCSGIEADQAAPQFHNCVKGALEYFLDYYRIEGREKFLEENYLSAADLLEGFCQRFRSVLGNRVFLMIDEYDQFANEVLSTDAAKFKEITSTKGFLKAFYARVKKYSGKVFDRIYITGVTPISLDSMTSGFSIAVNYSADEVFAETFGLTENELRRVIRDTVDVEKFGSTEEVLFARMKELYNGYRFSPDSEKSVFHAAMCMEYLRVICEKKREPRGAEVFDSSVAVDLSKIHGILSLGNEQFIRTVVDRCLKGQVIPFVDLSRTINLNQKDKFDDQDVLTTLFCMGYLTLAPGKAKALVCPNKTIQEQFFGYYFKYLSGFGSVSFDEDAIDAAGKALGKGDAEPFFRYVETCLKSDVGLHGHLQLSEAPIQYFILGAARSLRGFKTTAEDEARGVGYTDILIKPIADSAIKYTYLTELKYLTKEAGTPAAVAQKAEEAREQLNAYAATANFKNLPGLKKIAVVFVGSEIKSLQYV